MKKLKLHAGLLQLNKRQITDLTPEQMGGIKGGVSKACPATQTCYANCGTPPISQTCYNVCGTPPISQNCSGKACS